MTPIEDITITLVAVVFLKYLVLCTLIVIPFASLVIAIVDKVKISTFSCKGCGLL